MANPVTQFQIVSKDPAAASEFYAALFGWGIDDANPMGYRKVDTHTSEGIQGGIWPAPPQAPTFTQLFVSVNDVKAAAEKAAALGARILIPPTMLPEGDQMAVLLDPQGMSFGVWKQFTPAASS